MLRQQALAAAQSGDRDRARTLLEALVQETPRDEDAWMWLAGLTDSHDQALAYLSRALVINPANERARAGITWMHEVRLKAQAENQAQIRGIMDRGRRYLDRAQVDAAVWEFEAAIQKFPDVAELYANLAVAYYQQSRWSEAARELETAVRLQPDYVDAYYSLGVIREAEGDQERALESWERVVQLDPTHADARRQLIKAGRSPDQPEQTEAAPPEFFMLCRYCDGEITEEAPTCPHCGRTLFNVCSACGKLVDTGSRFCPSCHQPVSQSESRSVMDDQQPGQSLLSTLRRVEAEARPVKSEPEKKKGRKRLRPRTVILLLPVAAFWAVCALAGSIGLVFGFNPTWLPSSLYNLGHEIQVFAAPLPAVMLPYPTDRFAPGLLILVGLLMLVGTALRVKWAFYANFILAGGLLLVSLVDMFTGQHVATALVRSTLTVGVLALTLLASNEYEEGELSQRIAATPRDADLHYNRGLVYYKRGQLDEAIAEWQNVVGLKPADLPTRNLLGLALAERGRFKDALDHLEIARKLDPNDADTLNNIRDVQRMMQEQKTSVQPGS
jgi:tetratricopeptide (TPR) repeat protein